VSRIVLDGSGLALAATFTAAAVVGDLLHGARTFLVLFALGGLAYAIAAVGIVRRRLERWGTRAPLPS
jgi:hypothetical protein